MWSHHKTQVSDITHLRSFPVADTHTITQPHEVASKISPAMIPWDGLEPNNLCSHLPLLIFNLNPVLVLSCQGTMPLYGCRHQFSSTLSMWFKTHKAPWSANKIDFYLQDMKGLYSIFQTIRALLFPVDPHPRFPKFRHFKISLNSNSI